MSRSKQRRVMEDPDEDEVMIGEVQVNEEVEHPTSEVSVTEFDDWQQKEYEGTLRELQSQNDFMSFHGVPSSEVVNKEIIKTRWVLTAQGEGVKARFVMKHFNTWKDENNDFYAGTPTPVSFNLVLALAAKRVALGKSQTTASAVLSCRAQPDRWVALILLSGLFLTVLGGPVGFLSLCLLLIRVGVPNRSRFVRFGKSTTIVCSV